MVDYIEVNRRAYDVLAREYGGRARKRSPYEERIHVLAGTVLEHAKKVFSTISVLEVGPGSGDVLAFFENQGCRTTAVELSGKVASIAQRRSPRSVVVVSDVLAIDFADGRFEIIYAGAVIHLFPLRDAKKLLRSFYRWLRPEGVLFVNTTTHERSEEGFFEKVDYTPRVKRYRRKWKEEELIKQLEAVGFRVVARLFTDEKDRAKKWVGFVAQKAADG